MEVNTLDKVLDKVQDEVSRRTEQWEIVCEETEETHLSFSNNAMKSVSRHKRFGIGLRVICSGRIGFSCTTRPFSTRLVDDAVDSASFGQRAAFSFPVKKIQYGVPVYDKAISSFDERESKKTGNGVIEKLRGVFPKAQADVDIGASRMHVHLINSSGFSSSYEKSLFSFFAGALLTQEDGLLEVHEGHVQCSAALDVSAITQKIIRKLKLCKKNVTLPTGKFPVIFTPNAFSSLIGTLRPGVNGKMFQKGASPLIGKLNEKLFDAQLTLWDDPLMENAYGSFPFDGEGVSAYKKTIVENGVLKNILLDLQTAGQLRMKPTGNGARNFSTQPQPGAANWCVEEGESRLKEILGGIKEGLMVDELLGWSGNPLGGEFSGNVGLGYKIQNGKLTARVKNCIVSGNIYELFSRIGALSCEREWIYGTMLCPYAFFENVSVAGKG